MFRRRPSTADSTCRRLPISPRVFEDPGFYATTTWYVDVGYSRNGKYRIFRYCWSPDGTEPSAPIIPGVTVMPWSRRSHSHISKEDIRISARDWNNRAAASEGLQAPSHDSHTILRVVRKYQKRRLLRDHCKSETRTFFEVSDPQLPRQVRIQVNSGATSSRRATPNTSPRTSRHNSPLNSRRNTSTSVSMSQKGNKTGKPIPVRPDVKRSRDTQGSFNSQIPSAN